MSDAANDWIRSRSRRPRSTYADQEERDEEPKPAPLVAQGVRSRGVPPVVPQSADEVFEGRAHGGENRPGLDADLAVPRASEGPSALLGRLVPASE